MDVREKLVKLLKTSPTRNGYTDLGDIADHLIANGVVVLPCKIGDKVYVNYIYGRNKIITDSQMVCSIE